MADFDSQWIPSSFFSATHIPNELLYFIVIWFVIVYNFYSFTYKHTHRGETHKKSLCLVSHNFSLCTFFRLSTAFVSFVLFLCRSNGNSFIISKQRSNMFSFCPMSACNDCAVVFFSFIYLQDLIPFHLLLLTSSMVRCKKNLYQRLCVPAFGLCVRL